MGASYFYEAEEHPLAGWALYPEIRYYARRMTGQLGLPPRPPPPPHWIRVMLATVTILWYSLDVVLLIFFPWYGYVLLPSCWVTKSFQW